MQSDGSCLASAAPFIVGRLKKCPWAKTPERIKALLASIAHGKAIDHIRKHYAAKRGAGRIESFDDVGEAGVKFDIHSSPIEDEITAFERAKMVDYLKQHLKPREQDLLEDYFLSEMSYAEISEKHGIAIGSVGVLLKRGLDKLNRLLDGKPLLKNQVRELARLSLWFFCILP